MPSGTRVCLTGNMPRLIGFARWTAGLFQLYYHHNLRSWFTPSCIHHGHVRLLDGEQVGHEDGGPEDAQGIKGIKLCLLLKQYHFTSLHIIPMLNLLLQVLTFFATNEWKWSNDNVLKLNAELTDVDKKTFNFDLSTLNWADFMDDYVMVFLF